MDLRPTKKQLALLGLRADENFLSFYDKDDLYYDDLQDAIWCGVFGFCECGCPDYEIERIVKILDILKNRDIDELSELYKESNGYQIYLYILDNYGFTEHGHNIYGSWLTEKGEALRAALQYVYREQAD